MFKELIKRGTFNSMNLSEQVDAVTRNPSDIRYIRDPDKRVQLAAVEKRGDSIRYIKDPDIDVQNAAVLNMGQALQYIKDPSKDIQLMAVWDNGTAIRYIEDPDRDVQTVAVQNTGQALQYIKEPDKELQLMAVQEDGTAIQYIKNPDRDVQLAAVTQCGDAILCIDDPGRDIQLAAVRRDGEAIRHIDKPDKDMQIEAVRQNAYAIRYIRTPDREAQTEAVSRDGTAIQYVHNPDGIMVREACRYFEENPVGAYVKMTDHIASLYAQGEIHDSSLPHIARGLEENIEKIRAVYPEFDSALEASKNAVEEKLYEERGIAFMGAGPEGKPRGDVLFAGDSGLKDREETRREIQALCGRFTEHFNAYFIKPDPDFDGGFSVVMIRNFDTPKDVGGMACIQHEPETVMSNASIREIKEYASNFVKSATGPLTLESIEDINAAHAAIDGYISGLSKDISRVPDGRMQDEPAEH